MVQDFGAVSVAGLVDEITTMVERIFEALDSLRVKVERLYAERATRGVLPSAADLGELRPDIVANLGAERGLVVGSGYISDVGALRDRDRWLEWWKSERDGRPARLVVSLDPDSDEFLDYTRQPWFTTPRSTDRRHITGPYVDYLCTDEYSLTLTAPVHHDGRFVGVVGSDVFVRGLELVLLPELRALAQQAALVNAQGRVIVSNRARLATGSLVREPDVARLWPTRHDAPERGPYSLKIGSPRPDGRAPEGCADELHLCADLPLALLVSR
ncbi:cache domain-containing protein [Saccharopolyspora rosea]|uniref:Cache domain-containing protein n=1 Tax=Saccharopolyspora rosea TaxID=524884 RepID=A0ABW3FS20_9PSEU|nr:cache domain-containing protein [Saccharopolyspora rosea]